MKLSFPFFFFFVFFFTISGIFQPIFSAYATDPNQNLQQLESVGGTAGFDTSIFSGIGNVAGITGIILALPIIGIIKALYGLFALLLTALVINAGYIWLTARGNSDKVKEAINILKNALIGFVFLASSAIILYLVLLILGQISATEIL